MLISGLTATAFFASRQVSQNDTDRRLEYLFWRIWSSETLLYQTNLESLDRLVSRIVVEPLITRTQVSSGFLNHVLAR